MSKLCKLALLLRSDFFDISQAKGMLHERNSEDAEGFAFTCSDNRITFEDSIDSGRVYFMRLSNMVLTRRVDQQVFEGVQLLRPVNVYVPSTGPDVKLLDVRAGMLDLYRVSALDANRRPIPHAKVTLIDPPQDYSTELAMDACGQALVAENPTVFRSLIPVGWGLLIEHVGPRGETSGQ